MTDTELLDKKIDESGLRIGYICERLGISRQVFYNKRTNRTEFLPSQIESLCNILGINTLTERHAIFFARNVDKTSRSGGGVS